MNANTYKVLTDVFTFFYLKSVRQKRFSWTNEKASGCAFMEAELEKNIYMSIYIWLSSQAAKNVTGGLQIP